MKKASSEGPAREVPACVLHAGWIPDGDRGLLAVWGESVQPPRRPSAPGHPFHLPAAGLRAAVTATWPRLAGTEPRATRVWAVLPGNGKRPVPSLELQAEAEDDDTEAHAWGCWRLAALAFPDPLDLLCTASGTRAELRTRIRIAQDFSFWQRLAAELQRIVHQHQYLPALFAGDNRDGSRKGKRRSGPRETERFHAGWEIARDEEDRVSSAFAGAMPVVGRSIWFTRPRDPAVRPAHGPRALVRHFLAVNLHQLVGRTSFPTAIRRRVEGSLVSGAIGPGPAATPGNGDRSWSAGSAVALAWRRWRDSIQLAAAGQDARICFRLREARRATPDRWQLEWLLSSVRDPSMLVPLQEFWNPDGASPPGSTSTRDVLMQLGQAARICPMLWKGMNNSAPSGMVLSREKAQVFLREQAAVLQSAGFRVIVPAWWTSAGRRRIRLRLRARSAAGAQTAGNESSGMFGLDSLLHFRAEVVLDGKPLSRAERNRIIRAKQGLVQVRGQWMELGADEVARLEQHWDPDGNPQSLTVADALRAESGSADGEVEVVFDNGPFEALAALRRPEALHILRQPEGFSGRMRQYQIRGFSWLSFLEQIGLGACLADDMGLGKTVQVLAVVLRDRQTGPEGGPTLVIAPTSVLGNWAQEAKRFAPDLKTKVHHGPSRPKGKKALLEAIEGVDLVIASFGVARLDTRTLRQIPWRRVVVDEAQNIKNPSTAVTKAVRGLRAGSRIALTGTPVENRPLDLWSIFSFLNPGFLGTVTRFRKEMERPILRRTDPGAARRLRKMTAPFILRRLKTDRAIIRDLPDKIEMKARCNLTLEQATLYEAVLKDLEGKLEGEEAGGKRTRMVVALTLLKQICNHPAQYLQDGSKFLESRSHKLARVCEMLEEIENADESALVFTQFAALGAELERHFRKRFSGPVYYLHGGTPRARREHLVREFQHPDTERAIFVLSLRAGGTGITLTRANHVIHFDRWWNPAVENQATDRAYRIGQHRKVMVHKMVTTGTLEERIDRLIESKTSMVRELVGGGESWLANLDSDRFLDLVALNRGSAVVG